MIFHLSAAGTSLASWHITAIYKGSYGVAVNAASTWYEKTGDTESDTPQMVIQLENDDGHWKRDRFQFMFAPRHQKRQIADGGAMLLQSQTSPLPLPDIVKEALQAELRTILIESNIMISRDEWNVKYPGQALVKQRFSDFIQAREIARNNGEELAYHPKWAMMMKTPEDHQYPYKIEEDRENPVLMGNNFDGTWDEITVPDKAADPYALMRLLNSGWSMDEALIIIADDNYE